MRPKREAHTSGSPPSNWFLLPVNSLTAGDANAKRGVVFQAKGERGAPLARSPSPSWAGPARIPGRDPLTSPRANSTLSLSPKLVPFRSVPFCSYLGSSVLSPVMCWPLVSLPPSLSIQVYGGAVGVVSSPSCRWGPQRSGGEGNRSMCPAPAPPPSTLTRRRQASTSTS